MLAKKLIETAIPLKEINAASAREKSIRHGHPSTLHLWWARRPLATARAVLFASIVDDPSDRPDLYPTVEDQQRKKNDLFDLIKRMVQWENSNDEKILEEVRAEIKQSVGDRPIDVLDPFAGGGTIPLEAQRLGLKAHATDLNPVATLINKAMIEIPAHFKNKPPVNPDANRLIDESKSFIGAQGLAADVEYYGRRLKALAQNRIGNLYPTIEIDGSNATVIAWLWSRTVRCNNPACEKIFPLAHSFVLSKKQNAAVKPVVEGDRFHFEVEKNSKPVEGTITRTGARCIFCGADVKFEHIRAEGKAGRLGARLMAIVAEGKGGRIYLEPTDEHERAADVEPPEDTIDAPLPLKDTRAFFTTLYGLDNYNKLFTARQLTALTTFSDLISDVRDEVMNDCGAKEYADAVATYLALLVDKLANYCATGCMWNNLRDGISQVFGRQAIPMVWDYAESNPFSNSSGCFDNMLDWIVKCLQQLPTTVEGDAHQFDAMKPFDVGNVIVSTDPPYYDNVPYSDLSDFFYVWLRRSIKKIYPRLLMKMIPPKAEELISNPYRQGGKNSARKFFEDGMLTALKNIYEASTVDYPTTIYYAYKQDDKKADEGALSSGWETLLRSIVDAGFIIVGTWPLRTERAGRMRDNDSNALSTSIVIVCRKPAAPKEPCSYNRFLRLLSHDLEPKLRKLQSENLSPVDMSQAAIGPGMEIYSRYSRIMRGDGRLMDIRSALRLINKALDEFLNAQDELLDSASKFCVELYCQAGFEELKFGEAQLLATAKNESLTRIKDLGLIESGRGFVRLLTREELDDARIGDCIWALTQRAAWWLDQEGGIKECVESLLIDHEEKLPALKGLAYRLYNVSDRRRWTDEAQSYSQIVDSWDGIEFRMSKAREKRRAAQQTLDGMG